MFEGFTAERIKTSGAEIALVRGGQRAAAAGPWLSADARDVAQGCAGIGPTLYRRRA